MRGLFPGCSAALPKKPAMTFSIMTLSLIHISLIFQRFARKAVLRAKNTTESSVEFIFELSRRLMEKDRKTAKGLTDEVYALGGIEYFNIVMQNDDISS